MRFVSSLLWQLYQWSARHRPATTTELVGTKFTILGAGPAGATYEWTGSGREGTRRRNRPGRSLKR
jgi:hypothetical protein